MENINYEKRNNVGIITITRPKALNALNTETLKELDGAIDMITMDSEVYVLIITGSGDKAFVAGADISEMKNKNVFEGRQFGILGNRVFRKIEILEIPTIAAVNGFALGGGCELSLCCDIRIASENAKFGQPEVTLGITPGFGGTQRLPRTVGAARAKEIIYTGRIIKADEALQIGLVNKIVPLEELMIHAIDMAEKIAANAPIAVKYSKVAIDRGLQCDIDTALMYESEVFGQCFSTEDQKSAMSAFVEKRKLEGFKNK
jgi:enoyl-CoA hydratase